MLSFQDEGPKTQTTKDFQYHLERLQILLFED